MIELSVSLAMALLCIHDRPMARTRIHSYPTHKNMGRVPVMCVSDGAMINIEISGPESEA